MIIKVMLHVMFLVVVHNLHDHQGYEQQQETLSETGTIICDTNDQMVRTAIELVGGNAILQPEQEATYDNQYNNVITATEKMIEIRKAGHEIVVTHGNG